MNPLPILFLCSVSGVQVVAPRIPPGAQFCNPVKHIRSLNEMKAGSYAGITEIPNTNYFRVQGLDGNLYLLDKTEAEASPTQTDPNKALSQLNKETQSVLNLPTRK